MALKAILDTLDGLHESIQSQYKKDETTGKFVLDAEGLVPKEKLTEFRDTNIRLLKEKKEYEDKYGSVDLEEYLAMKEERAKNKNKKMIEEGKFDEAVELRVVEMRTKLTKEKEAALKEKQEAERHLAAVLIDNEIQKEALPFATETGMEDIVTRGRAVFQLKDGKVVPVEGDRIRYGADGVTPLSVKEWLEQLSTKAPHLFKASKGSGADSGSASGGSGYSGTVTKKSELKTVKDKAAFISKHGRDAYLKLPA